MIEYQNINKGESGLSVRAKLNKMFSALITGSEGVNQVWVQMQKVLNSYDDLEKLTEAQYEELKDQVLKSFDYTDMTAQDLITYINAINGGVAGFADNTEYNPNIPEDKAATIIAIGPGTYTYFKDADGVAITITEPQSFTVFYKGENSNYWKHKTINLEVTYPPITQELGNSETDVMSQNAVTTELDSVRSDLSVTTDKLTELENELSKSYNLDLDGFIKTSDGSFSSNTNWKASDFINVTTISIINYKTWCNNSVTEYALYNGNKKLISLVIGSQGYTDIPVEKELVINDERVAYVRFSNNPSYCPDYYIKEQVGNLVGTLKDATYKSIQNEKKLKAIDGVLLTEEYAKESYDGYISDSGTIQSGSYWKYMFLHVKEGTEINSNGNVSGGYRTGFMDNTPSVGNKLDVILPEDTVFPLVAEHTGYFCISAPIQTELFLYAKQALVEVNTEIKNINQQIIELNEKIDTKSADNAIYIIYSKDNKNLITYDGRINKNDGSIQGDSSFKHIALDVSEGDVITFTPNQTGTGSGFGYAFYDENDSFISGESPVKDIECTVVVPIGAKKWKYGFYAPYWDDDDNYSIYSTFVVEYLHYIEKSLTHFVESYSKAKGLTWNAVGDSVTDMDRYESYAASLLDINVINKGIGGCCIAVSSRPDAYGQTNQSVVERVCGINGNTAIPDADMWTIFGGLNDIVNDTPVGELMPVGSDYDITTLYGALQKSVEKILSYKTDAKLMLICPQRSNREVMASKTLTMETVREVIKNVGYFYSVKVVDAGAECGICEFNFSQTQKDGIHPEKGIGEKMLGTFVAKSIKEWMVL